MRTPQTIHAVLAALTFLGTAAALPAADPKTDKAAPKKAEGKGSGEKADGGQPDSKAKTGSSPPPANPDAEFVKAGLKDFIQGTVSFADDGTVSIDYEFKEKKEEMQDDFLPPILSKPQGTFRWSVYQEERVIGGDYGIRISDRGGSFLNVWFTDEVEAEAEFLQGIGWSAKQVCAVAFQTKGGKAVANNFGGQCALFSGPALQSGVPPKTESCPFDKRVKIGLKLKGGSYEALRDGKARGSAKYSPKTFSSGRIGFIWGGNLAGTLTTLKVKGKLDYTATAQEMRKRAPAR